MFLSDHDACTPGHTCRDCDAAATEAIEVEFEGGGRVWYALCEGHARDLLNRLHERLLREMDKEWEEEERGRMGPLAAALDADAKSEEALREEALYAMVR